MNPNPTEPIALTPTPKRRTKSKSTTPRKARVLDPEVAKIKAEAKERVKELHRGRASAKVLKQITDKLVHKLIDAHIVELVAFLRIQPTFTQEGAPKGEL